MAAMDVVRSRSQFSASPPSISSESFRQEQRAATPEPHYRLSRLNLNTPPPAALRPPSIICRSVSAGMTFPFRQKEKEKEKEKQKEMPIHPRAPSPDDRPHRFGFTLRKKVSLASLLSRDATSYPEDAVSSRTSSSSGSGHPTLVVSPVAETPSPVPVALEEDEEGSDGDEDVHAPERFVKKDVWRTRHKMKLHPYPDAPYMQAYDPVVLESERSTHHLLRRLVPPGSPTFHQYTGAPPATALDLGCGTGLWLMDTARTWRTTQLVGLDLVDVAVSPLTDGTLPNVRLFRGDFLKYALPFPAGAFDLVRMANLALCVPEPAWEPLFKEVWRILAPGGRLELVDDQLYFPYGDVPIEETTDVPAEQPTFADATPQPGAMAAAPLSPSTPRPPPPTPDVSGFFDSSDEESEGSGDAEAGDVVPHSDEVFLAPAPDSASNRSSRSSGDTFNDTASTLIGEPSERGSLELKKRSSEPPQLEFEPMHRPFSGVEHLIISIPSPELLPTVDVAIEEGEMPLTPVPPHSGAPAVGLTTPTSTAPEPAAAQPLSESPPAAIHPAFTVDSSGPWSTQCAASLDLERVFMGMLTSRFKLLERPAAVTLPTLARVFCDGRTGRVDRPTSFHLKLAPVELADLAAEARRDSGRGLRTWMTTVEWEREGKEKEKDRESMRRGKGAKKDTQQRLNETPLPQGLSAKAAERLGIVGAGVSPVARRQPTLLESPEESDEEDYGEVEEAATPSLETVRAPLGRGASTWVPPSEWGAPPEDLVRSESEGAIAPSSSSKTIASTGSTKTVTTATSTRTLTPAHFSAPPAHRTESPQPLTPSSVHRSTHSRGGSTASRTHTRAGSTASIVSTASSGGWSAIGPQSVAQGRVQHPGLVLWPGTFIPLSPAELEMHATRHMQTLLGCKPALAEYVGTFVDPMTGERVVSEQAFEDAVWEYECFRRPRFNWPELSEARMEEDEVVPDMPTPGSARSMQHVIPRTPTASPDPKMTVGPYMIGELTHVRSFRVFGAIKGSTAPVL